jgi:hypothetical protein
MSNKLVLLLGHKAQSGKDTFYNFVKDSGFHRAAFADHLKEVVQDLYQFSNEQMYGDLKDVEDKRYPNTVDQKLILKPEWEAQGEFINNAYDNGVTQKDTHMVNPEYKAFFTPRRILQIFGQQQRLLYPDIWADYVFNVTVPKLLSEGTDRIIVTDFRFRNEAAVAKRFAQKDNIAVKFIKIVRPSLTTKDSDQSENDLNDFPNWDLYLNNDSTLERYKKSVLQLVTTFL